MNMPVAGRVLVTLAILVSIAGIIQLRHAPVSLASSNELARTNVEIAATAETSAAPSNPIDDPWSAQEIVQPEDLARSLSGEHKPIVLQVGIIHLYRLSHIPGSKYAGPGSSAEGLELLKKEVQGLPRTSEIVYYCGCCPWKDCPNIRPPHKALKEMGFKNVKVLNIPNSFGQDWVSKGLPTEKGGTQ